MRNCFQYYAWSFSYDYKTVTLLSSQEPVSCVRFPARVKYRTEGLFSSSNQSVRSVFNKDFQSYIFSYLTQTLSEVDSEHTRFLKVK